MVSNALEGIRISLTDLESRRHYGSENIKLDLALTMVEGRKRQELTQQELAHLAGVSQAYIAKLESGEANPTVGHIGSILAAMWLGIRFESTPLVPAIDSEPHPSDLEDFVLDLVESGTRSADHQDS